MIMQWKVRPRSNTTKHNNTHHLPTQLTTKFNITQALNQNHDKNQLKLTQMDK